MSPASSPVPSVCRMVRYRPDWSLFPDLAAVVIATTETINPDSVDAGVYPALDSDRHVHLWVFDPAVEGGGFRVFNSGQGNEVGDWAWPPRA